MTVTVVSMKSHLDVSYSTNLILTVTFSVNHMLTVTFLRNLILLFTFSTNLLLMIPYLEIFILTRVLEWNIFNES